MVKRRKKNSRKKLDSKGFNENTAKAIKINASTHYETCTEQLSPFGGLLALIKFFSIQRVDGYLRSAKTSTTRCNSYPCDVILLN